MKGRGRKSVFHTYTLTFQRKGPSYLDANFKLVETEDGVPFDIQCDLQPLTMRAPQQVESPEGYTLSGAKWMSSQTLLNTIEDVSATPADVTTIDGREYYVWKVLDYRGSVLNIDKYIEYAMIMKALPNTGAP